MTVLLRSEDCSFHDCSHLRFSHRHPPLPADYLLRSTHCFLGFQILFQGRGLSKEWVAQLHTHFKSTSKRGPLSAPGYYNKGSVLYVKICLKDWATPTGETMGSSGPPAPYPVTQQPPPLVPRPSGGTRDGANGWAVVGSHRTLTAVLKSVTYGNCGSKII